MNLLKKAWDEKIRRFGRVLHESAAAVKLFPMPLSTLGGGILIHIEHCALLQSTLLRDL